MSHLDVRGLRVPNMLYGTAWKEDATEPLVFGAISTGFRGIDTANQRKHYDEAGVGRGLARAFANGLRRDELFIQTKFTYVDGQDQRLPYDPLASIAEQVAQSFRSSLEHLGVPSIDSLVLHGPSQRDGLGRDDHEAWRAMEALAVAGQVKLLGISNATAGQVSDLVAFARIPPAFVQNRCYADRGWDQQVRTMCDEHGIVYQGFSLLTANRRAVDHPDMRAIAKRHGQTPAQVVFRFAQQVGMLPLTGTKDPSHMAIDLATDQFELAPQEVATIAGVCR